MSVTATRRPVTQAAMPPTAIATVISAKLPIPGVRNVISVATTMPMPAQTMPLRAVTGELMRFRPRMNRAAAMK